MLLDRRAPVIRGTDRQPSASGLSRRDFLQVGVAAGGGLLLSLSLPALTGGADAADATSFVPNAFIRIEPDGQIVLTMPYVEMGQGTYTSIPMLIAEELQADLKQVQLEHAPPDERLYGNPLVGGVQATGGSNAIRAMWQPMREAGATARIMLVEAAAKRWNVDPATCHAESGQVLHAATGRRAKYGDLAAEAARMPAPKKVTLKPPEDFKLIGTSAKRLDAPAKVNGTAVYGIDVKLPGLKIATLAQSPVFGGRVKSVDDAAAKAVKGVRQIVQLDNVVAVVADHMGAATEGAGGSCDPMGRRAPRQAEHRRHRGRARKGDAQFGAGCTEHRRRRQGDGRRRHQGRGDLPGPFPRACDDGTDELHGPSPQGRLRGLGRQPGRRASPGGGRKDRRTAVG